MLLSEITRYVADRTGENKEADLLKEINLAMQKLWLSTDLDGSLFELDVIPTRERIMSLPWFVYQVKAVRRCHGTIQQLYSIRPYFHEHAGKQTSFEWRFLHRTPLIVPAMNIGRLTIRPRRPLTAPITITLKGPGEFGVTEIETLSLNAGEKSVESAAVYHDLSSLTKSAVTNADLEIRDITNAVVAVLPADRLDVWNQLVRISDKCIDNMTDDLAMTVLYKAHPPVFTTTNDAVMDEVGIIIQNIVTAELLAKSKDKVDQDRMKNHAGEALSMISQAARRHGEGKLAPVLLTPAAHVHEYNGYL